MSTLVSTPRIESADVEGGSEPPPSVAKASGVWFCTLLMIGFVFTQSSTFFPDRPALIALAYWIPIGLILDFTARRWHPIASSEAVQRSSNRAWYGVILLASSVALVWTLFRPSETVVSTGAWVGQVNLWLDAAAVALPGLKYSGAALTAAGRPDIAAYFGAYLVSCSILWMVGLAVLGRLLGILPVSSLRRGKKLIDELEKVYPASRTWRTYLWRGASTFVGWALFALALTEFWAVWHQDVTGAAARGAYWLNAFKGVGAFVPAVFIALVAVPGVAYIGLLRRLAFKRERQARIKADRENSGQGSPST